MGILGLTTYINNHSDRYLQHYELQDTYLVIDGNSICTQIYSCYAKCNCAFGGDYDKYAQCVSHFFDNLLKCKVIPLVLFDGGWEDRKLKTVINRVKNQNKTAASYSFLSRSRATLFPLLMKQVFKDVMEEKNIRHVQCLFEADNDIAAVARSLECPVLSYDSDFYIYGAMYIPFDTLDNYVIRKPARNGYMIRCKLYRVENLYKSFEGLNDSTLPLAAVLLGNDYVQRGTFENFFRHLQLKGTSKKKHNRNQCRIEAVFNWLSNYTLDKAVIAILSRLSKPMRAKMLNIIESNINAYTNVSPQILIPLGFSKEFVSHGKTYSVNRTFKFDGDINNITSVKETYEGESETSEEDDENEVEIIDITKECELISHDSLINKLPVWFIHEFHMVKYPACFINLIVSDLYICPIQVEDYFSPSSIKISLNIISVIFELLKSGVDNNIRIMKYMTRDHTKNIVCHELEVTNNLFPYKLPSLFDLREIPIISRRQILDHTLRITNEPCVSELPPEWILYIGCIKYWFEQQELYQSQKCYLYSLIVSMLFNVIDSKIGTHRSIQKFQKRYNVVIQTVQQRRKANNYKPEYSMDITIADACEQVDENDCLIVSPFFISHFKMDSKLYTNPRKFNKSTVHAFAEFQTCLAHTMYLNALLGYPYRDTKIANFFNGTLLYNLCSNFKTRHNIEVYINSVFQNSPSILRLFNVFLSKIKPMFSSFTKRATKKE